MHVIAEGTHVWCGELLEHVAADDDKFGLGAVSVVWNHHIVNIKVFDCGVQCLLGAVSPYFKSDRSPCRLRGDKVVVHYLVVFGVGVSAE